MRDKVAKQIYDDPNPRLSNDYFEYMDNAVDRMDDLLEIERLGGDLTPKPIFDGTEIIGAQVDFKQLDKLGNKAKDNIIPFKPRTKKFMGGILSDAELANPRYNSNTGEYEIGGGVKLGNLELDMLARGLEGYDPIMQYEGMLDLGNDFMLKGGYYDDAIMEPGMMSPEDEIKFLLTKGFANGGTVPPQKGPMSDGMGSLFRSK